MNATNHERRTSVKVFPPTPQFTGPVYRSGGLPVEVVISVRVIGVPAGAAYEARGVDRHNGLETRQQTGATPAEALAELLRIPRPWQLTPWYDPSTGRYDAEAHFGLMGWDKA